MKNNNISAEEKILLENIFRKFGNYDINFLASNIEKIMEHIPVVKKTEWNVVNEFEVSNFFTNLNPNYEEYKNNKIFNFIENFKYIKSYYELLEEEYEEEYNDKIFAELIVKIKRLDIKKQKKLLNYLESFKDNNDKFLVFNESDLHKSLIK